MDEVVGEVSKEWGMPTAPDKHERLVIRSSEGRKKRRGGEAKWVKWLGIILDEDLSFDDHWQKRIEKARSLLGALKEAGNSEWGLSPRGWRQVYTGMFRTVATWGAELGWRGQKRWEEELERLQYDSVRKCVGAVKGASKEKVWKIAGVERMSTSLDGMQARFVARRVKEKYVSGRLWEGGLQRAPRIADTHEEFDTRMDYVAAKALGPLTGEITPGALVQKVDISVIDLDVPADAPRSAWKEAIDKATVGHIRVYTDSCKDPDGVVGGAWWRSSGKFGARRLGTGALYGMGITGAIIAAVNCFKRDLC